MHKILTTDLIESGTTNSNLERGRQLFQNGYVSGLKIINNKFIVAKVQGNRVYHVLLEPHNKHYKAFCSCPYKPKGQCKHQVAVKYSFMSWSKKKNTTVAEKEKIARSKFYDSMFKYTYLLRHRIF